MRKIIHHVKKIRHQPEETRRHISHVLTIICGVILLLLWIYSLGARGGAEEVEVEKENGLEPLSVFKDNIVNGYKSLDN